MNLLAVSVAPLFKDAIHGGSQRILTVVAQALAAAGHQVRIACSARPENEGGFELAGGPGDAGPITVAPVLRLRGYFPDPYEVPPNQLADTALNLRPLMDWAERIYLHADIFHFRPLLPKGAPVVRSFHDFHYETALVSAFSHGADLTIVPSNYLRRCIETTVGRSGLRTLEPIEVIPNGIDLDRYGPGSPPPPAGIAPRRTDDLILLHPHRPDPRKGIEQALRVVRELRSKSGARRVRLLVPRHVDADADPATAAYYADVEGRARELGVTDCVEFHSWFGDREMPALYRSADATLCLGNFIESFGLTAYESLACGTPVVAARVGALREAPDLPGLRKVEFGDTASATDAVLEAGRGMSAGDVESARATLRDRFSLRAMTAAYVNAIEGAGRLVESEAAPAPAGTRGAEARYELAPWCHVAGDRIYSDYAYRHLDLPGLARALTGLSASGAGSVVTASLIQSGGLDAELKEAMAMGIVVPASRH